MYQSMLRKRAGLADAVVEPVGIEYNLMTVSAGEA